MSQIRNLVTPALVALAAGIVVACSEPTPTGTAPNRLNLSTAGVPDTGEFEVCKYGTAATFTYTIDGGSPMSASLNDGDCAVLGDIGTYGVGIHTFTISEDADPTVVFDSIIPWKVTVLNHTPTQLATVYVPTYSATFSGDVGYTLKFYNEPAPPPPPPSNGCTLTQGYWKNHTSDWPAPYSPSATFYTSGQTWLQVLNTPPKGNAYYILAEQFIAATLNGASGASVPSSVQQALTDADAYFTDPGSSSLTRSDLIAMASLLDDYNNGLAGVPHCDD